MKQAYILTTLLLSLSNAYSQGIGGVEATISSDNIELKFTLGHLYPPISVQTVWIGDYDDNVLEYTRLQRASQSLYVETDAQGFPIDANGTRVDAEDAVPKPYHLNSECPN